MKSLRGFYFSGTGNTKYAVERLCEKLASDFKSRLYDISAQSKGINSDAFEADLIVLAFPVYGSSPPVPMRQFVSAHCELFKDKQVAVLATQYMFSGDGAASLGRLVEKCGGKVCYAEHINMPNNLADFKAFKVRNGKELDKKLAATNARIDSFAHKILSGTVFRRGFNVLSHAVGYYCQRKWWRKGEAAKKRALKIDALKCTGCGLCVKKCPAGNIKMVGENAKPQGNCALCYRCVNLCPQKAITLCGKEPPAVQYKGITKVEPKR